MGLITIIMSLFMVVGYASIAAYFGNVLAKRIVVLVASIAVCVSVLFLYGFYPVYNLYLNLQAGFFYSPIKMDVDFFKLCVPMLKNVKHTVSLMCYLVPPIAAMLLAFSTISDKTEDFVQD